VNERGNKAKRIDLAVFNPVLLTPFFHQVNKFLPVLNALQIECNPYPVSR
jgi:hypothetical protein